MIRLSSSKTTESTIRYAFVTSLFASLAILQSSFLVGYVIQELFTDLDVIPLPIIESFTTIFFLSIAYVSYKKSKQISKIHYMGGNFEDYYNQDSILSIFFVMLPTMAFPALALLSAPLLPLAVISTYLPQENRLLFIIIVFAIWIYILSKIWGPEDGLKLRMPAILS